jgi:hypothetical protein
MCLCPGFVDTEMTRNAGEGTLVKNDQQFNDHTRVCNFQLSDIHVCHCSPNLLHLSQFVTKQTKKTNKQTNKQTNKLTN